MITMALLFMSAFVMEIIDAGLGMCYGTVLAPLLIICGYDVQQVVPAILLSQALGGLCGGFFHHKFDNISLTTNNKDLLFVSMTSGLGILAAVIATLVATNIDKYVLNLYIGFLVTAMGLVILFKKPLIYKFRYDIYIALLSAFNKGLSGGGFGPVMTGGQIIIGNECKTSIARTTLSEPLICITGFFMYLLNAHYKMDFTLILILSIGAILGAPLGAKLTSLLDTKVFKIILGVLVLTLGILMLIFKIKA
jgi:hypothetical protein